MREHRKITEKAYRRVDKFSGGDEEWRSWEFDFKVATRAVDAKMVEALETAEVKGKTLTGKDFENLNGTEWKGMDVKARAAVLTGAAPL